MLRAASIMPRACQLSAPARIRILRRLSLVADLHDERLAALEVGEGVLGILGGLGQHRRVRRHGIGSLIGCERVRVVVRGRPVGVRLGAGADLLGLRLGFLGARDVLGNFRVVELLAVLHGQDAAEKLDDVDRYAALISRLRTRSPARRSPAG